MLAVFEKSTNKHMNAMEDIVRTELFVSSREVGMVIIQQKWLTSIN